MLLVAGASPEPKSDPPAPLAPLAASLAHASGRTQAIELEIELETRRQATVQPAVRLLLRRSQRERAEGDPRAALSDLDDALTLQPDNALLWREHGSARADTGDADGAVADLGGALSRDPTDVLAWETLTGIEANRNSWMAAYKAWQHVLSLDPQAQDGAKRLDRLRRRAFGQPA